MIEAQEAKSAATCVEALEHLKLDFALRLVCLVVA